MEEYEEVSPALYWLVTSFWDLHEGRPRYGLEGNPGNLDPLKVVRYGREVLRLSEDFIPWFLAIMQAVDRGVMGKVRENLLDRTKKGHNSGNSNGRQFPPRTPRKGQ